MRSELSNSELSKVLYKNTKYNYLIRLFVIIFGFLYTRVTLDYLGDSSYGIWVTLTSIIALVNAGDFGIGNGLRNHLAIAYASNEIEKQKKLIVSSAKAMLTVSLVFVFVLFFVSEALIRSDVFGPNMRIPLYITFLFFCLDLFLGTARSIAYGYQKSWLVSMTQLVTISVRILLVLVQMLGGLDPNNFVRFAILNGIGGVVGNVFLIIVLRRNGYLSFPTGVREYYDSQLVKTISKLGVRFFLLQISALVLYSTDNIIIKKLISPEAVTRYDIITKIYLSGEELFAILMVSLWSAVSYAAAKNEFGWIQKEKNKHLLLWGGYSCGVIVVSFLLNWIVSIWIGDDSIQYDLLTILLFAGYNIITSFGAIYVNITNGIGRLGIQTVFAILGAVINIPLSVFFARTCNYGAFGVKLATFICILIPNIIIPIDVTLFLRRHNR